MVELVVDHGELILDGQRLPILTAEIAERIEKEQPEISALSLNLLKLKTIEKWPRLEKCHKLSFRDNHLSLDAVPLHELSTAMPSLRVLSIGGNKLHHDPPKFADAIKLLTNLQVIDISDLNDSERRNVAEICFASNLPNLREVAGVSRDGNIIDSDEDEDDEDDDEEDEEDDDEEGDDEEGNNSSRLAKLMGDESLSSDSEDFAVEDEESVPAEHQKKRLPPEDTTTSKRAKQP